ncbi:cell wall-binding repeat-containing protein [Arthrobacter sulfonylureivorans]|uniref:Cell wall-binding repeat-containing protein n=1 Tax=Arthrobacter sulfonylureivorans TaxID=2486855 RepID=A0ABY3WAU7_9MICC|nr:cell wall-binding repeat-containing protein [Arthrobacter sulfonylureivorans]UNK47459.1 cell wall-binding repeat-containing protein [Arthrobacter sulfonylureivorans]
MKALYGERGAAMGKGEELAEENAARLDDPGEQQKLDETLEALDIERTMSVQALTATAPAPADKWRPAGIQGIDVSNWQGANINWQDQYDKGIRFAYAKSTEGNYFTDKTFANNYTRGYRAGIIRGAYHFAIPRVSTGRAQAEFMLKNGGGWSADGLTLPPLLDIEHNPYSELYGNMCYDMSATSLVNWIKDFSNTIKAKTGRLPAIYTTASWWNKCTGNSTAFNNHPLHVAGYPIAGWPATDAPTIPNGWKTWDIWQYSSTGPFIGDSNVWRGSLAQLKSFAKNASFKSGARITKSITTPGTSRLAGSDRYATAVAISQRSFNPGVDSAFIASGAGYADALAGGPAAAHKAGPVLFVSPNGIPSVVKNELNRLKPRTIYILGGTGAVSSGVKRSLQQIATVKRIGGADRYETASNLVDHVWGTAHTIYVASGADYPDALAGGAAAGGQGAPVLMTMPNGLPNPTAATIKRLKPSRVVVLGGTGAVSKKVAGQIASALKSVGVSASQIRYAGSDRYDTAAKVARGEFPATQWRIMYASGLDYPDALASAPAAAVNGAPILLTRATCSPDTVAKASAAFSGALSSYGVSPVRIIAGGSGVVTTAAPTKRC